MPHIATPYATKIGRRSGVDQDREQDRRRDDERGDDRRLVADGEPLDDVGRMAGLTGFGQ